MSKKKNEAPFDYLKSIITANIPDYDLFYSFKQIKTAITNTSSNNSKEKRKELKKNLKKLTYDEVSRINIIAEQTLMQILNTGTEEYFMQQLYKFPLTGLKIEIYLNQKLIQGIIALETKNIIYIVTSEYKTKQFYKKNLVFVILINLNRYLIIGNNLKLNRFN